MNISKLSFMASLCVLIASTLAASSQGKMDADTSDIAALLQRVTRAHDDQIPELRKGTDPQKACAKSKLWLGENPSWTCHIMTNRFGEDVLERALLKGCSYEAQRNRNPSCEGLAVFYSSKNRDIESLAVLKLPNMETTELFRSDVRLGAYKELGNQSAIIAELHHQCYDLDLYRGCMKLRSSGAKVDMEDASDRARERRTREAIEADRSQAQKEADDAQDRAWKERRNQLIVEGVQGIASTAVSSYGNYQAGIAQARTNIEAAKLSQQNKNAGGYPTTSSSGSSGSGSSTTTVARQAPKRADTTAPDTDASSDAESTAGQTPSTSASGSVAAFNGYSPQPSAYNPYGAAGIPPVDSTIPGEKGHWAESELVVTCWSKTFPRTFISAVLVSASGNPDGHGPFCSVWLQRQGSPALLWICWRDQ